MLFRSEVIILDPMLATAVTAIKAVQLIKESGAKSIKFMCILSCPEGIKALTDAHPDIDIYCGAMDDGLNEDFYIIPGFGDASDRIFGTK